jgi:hypothetical protein
MAINEEQQPPSAAPQELTDKAREDKRPPYTNTMDDVKKAQDRRERRERESTSGLDPRNAVRRKQAIKSERSLSTTIPLAPEEVASVRRRAYNIINKQIPTVSKVLDGTTSWNNQQVRLFSIMLNKVMPDLHHSFNEVSIEEKSLTELSISELETIVKQAALAESRATLDDAIATVEDAEYTQVEPNSPEEAALLATPDMRPIINATGYDTVQAISNQDTATTDLTSATLDDPLVNSGIDDPFDPSNQ